MLGLSVESSLNSCWFLRGTSRGFNAASQRPSEATHPFDSDDEDSGSDGSGVDPVAPAVLVDPHCDGQHSEHGDTGALGLIKVAQS